MQGSLVGNPVQGSPLVRISELHLNSENSGKAKMRHWVLSGQGWSSSSLSYISILRTSKILRRPSCVIGFFPVKVDHLHLWAASQFWKIWEGRDVYLGPFSSRLIIFIFDMHLNSNDYEKVNMSYVSFGPFKSRTIFSSMWSRILVV